MFSSLKRLALSLFLACFVLGQILCSYKGIESFPFFLYGMYSAPVEARAAYSIDILSVNGRERSFEASWAVDASLLQSQWHYLYNFAFRFGGEDPQDTRWRNSMYAWALPRLSNTGKDLGDYALFLREYLQQRLGEDIRCLRLERYILKRERGAVLQRAEKPSFCYFDTCWTHAQALPSSPL